MRIALLSQSYPPIISGAALFTEGLATGFSARGNQVLVLTASDQADPYVSNGPNLIVKRFQSYRNPFRVGQRFAMWPHKQVIQSLAEFTPDVLHLHDPFQFALSGLSFGHQQNIPVIVTIHGLPCLVGTSLSIRGGFRKIVEAGLWRYGRWVLGRCSRAVVATQTIADIVFALTRVYPQVISCGVNLVTFSPAPSDSFLRTQLRARWGIPEGAPLILYVGRLDRDKGVEGVVQAAALAIQKTPAHLLIVGDGTERASLEQQCARLGIGERSHFTGFVSIQNGLPALYQMSTVFVTASMIETQGLVLLEAAACGLPIVAAQATCMHEIVHEGQNGFLLPCGNPVGMAKRICELIQDPAKAYKMGLAGRQIVESHAVERTIAAYENVYQAAIREVRIISSPTTAEPGRAAHSGGCD